MQTKTKIHKLKHTFGIAPPSQSAEALAARPSGKSLAASKTSQPASQPSTEIAARIDVGLGMLFIRGQGDGLSWEKGAPLVCKDASTWVWSTGQATDKLVFKLLLNDVIWAQGEDVVLQAGKRIEIVPTF